MNRIFLITALLALSFAAWGQAERVKTVETPDSASLVIFDNTNTEYNSINVQGALEELDFDAGDVLYVATTGNDATGVIGYPNKPFVPSATFDINQNRLFNWYYPGIYNIGPGQEFPYTFSTTGKPFPFWLYAPQSSLNLVGNGNHYAFKLPGGGQTDSIFHFDIGQLRVQDVAFVRTSEGQNAKIIGKVGTFIVADSISGGDSEFVVQNMLLEIDSLNANRNFCYTEPRTGDQNTIKINVAYSDQTYLPSGSKSAIFNSSSLFDVTASGSYFNLEINKLNFINTAMFFKSNWGGDDRINSYEKVWIKQNFITDDLLPDTLFSNNIYEVGSVGARLASKMMIAAGIDGAGSDKRQNTYYYKFNQIESSKGIFIYAPGKLDKYTIEIDQGLFTKSRIIQLSNFVSDTAQVFINCNNCICLESTPIINLSTDATSKVSISGRYTTERPGNPVIYSNSDLYIRDVELINDGVSPAIIAGTPINVYVQGVLHMNSDSTHPNVTFIKVDYGYTNPVNQEFESTQIVLESIFSAIPKQSATFYQETLRQYAFTSGDTILIDTITNALITDSITQDTGYIRNISSDTMRWQVSYNLFRDSDEDPLYTFVDLTTDGSDAPEAIEGSRAYSEQAVALGTQHAGPTFIVDVPPGDAIRLCVYGSVVAAGVAVSDLAITVTEIYRE